MQAQLKIGGVVHVVPVEPGDKASVLFDYASRSGLDASTVKIVGKRGRRVNLDERLDSIDLSGRLLVLGTPSADVAKVASARSDPLLRGFDAESEREQQRRSRDDGPRQHDEYKFCRFEVCERFMEPHYYEALRVLHRLASRVSFLLVEHKWTVGALVELDPRDDKRLKEKEKDGGCLLGYNENFGARIYVRLRNDHGFRDEDDLAQTLLHELAHNVYGPHGPQFFALYAALRKAYLEKYAWRADGLQSELQMEASNTAMSPAERASAALVANAVVQDEPVKRRTHDDRALAAHAAEARRATHRRSTEDAVASAARSLPADALATLRRILRNLETSDDPKFQRLRLANEKFHQTCGRHPAALDLLAAVGFEKQDDDALVLGHGKRDPALLRLAGSIVDHYQQKLLRSSSA